MEEGLRLSVGELLIARTPAGRDASQGVVCAMTDTLKRLGRGGGEVLAHKQTQGHARREENLGKHHALSFPTQLTQADGAQRPTGHTRQPAWSSHPGGQQTLLDRPTGP